MSSSWSSDVRLAARTLWRAPGFTLVAVLSLGGGLALCVTVLTLLQAYLGRALPYPAADRLFSVQYAAPGQEGPQKLETLDWASLSDVVEHPIAWDLDVFYLRGAPFPEAARGTWVTPGYVEGFGIRPAMGRGFVPGDFGEGRAPVALISHRLWQQRFGGDRGILGRQFQAYVSDRPDEAETFTIVGVLPATLWHLNPFTEVLAPLRASTYPYIVRLRAGVTPELARDRITALVRAGAANVPRGWQATLRSTHEGYVSPVKPVLWTLMAATGLVLAIACANVAVLLLVRATRRRREIAVRKALGASAAQIVSGLVAEGLLLGGTATAIGVGAGHLLVTSLGPLVERQLGRGVPGGTEALALDMRILGGAVACGLFTTIGCMLAPWLTSRRTPVALALGAKGATEGSGQRRTQSALIALELAIGLTLLAGATLALASGWRMLRVDFGLEPAGVTVAGVGLRQRSYPEPAALAGFYDRLLTAAEATPLRGLALNNWWPLQPAPVRAVRRAGSNTAEEARAGVLAVSAGYFDALGIPLRDGRGLASGDRLGSEPVAVVSTSLARRLSVPRVVGERIRIEPDPDDEDGRAVEVRIVGVVGDVRQGHADEDLADVYLPLLQEPSRFMFAFVHGNGASVERDLRALLGTIDADVPIASARSLDAIIDEERSRPRFLAALLLGFALLAVLLALVGLTGVVAYAIRQREREIAVRMAIGADAGAITRLFVRQGGLVLAAGVVLGLCGALGLGRLLRSQLFGIEPSDPGALAAATLAFTACAALAIWLPARRASRLDPASVLKQE